MYIEFHNKDFCINMHKDILKEYFSQIAPHISWSTYNYFCSFWDVLVDGLAKISTAKIF